MGISSESIFLDVMQQHAFSDFFVCVAGAMLNMLDDVKKKMSIDNFFIYFPKCYVITVIH